MILNFKFNQESKYTLKELNRKRKKKKKLIFVFLILCHGKEKQFKTLEGHGREKKLMLTFIIKKNQLMAYLMTVKVWACQVTSLIMFV